MQENSFEQKIGNTVFFVCGKSSEQAKETLEKKLKKLILKEIEEKNE